MLCFISLVTTYATLIPVTILIIAEVVEVVVVSTNVYLIVAVATLFPVIVIILLGLVNVVCICISGLFTTLITCGITIVVINVRRNTCAVTTIYVTSIITLIGELVSAYATSVVTDVTCFITSAIVDMICGIFLYVTLGTFIPVLGLVCHPCSCVRMSSYLANLTTDVTCGVASVIVLMYCYIGLITADSTFVPVVGCILAPLVRIRMSSYLASLATYVTCGVARVIVDMYCYIGLNVTDSTLVPVVGRILSPLVRVRMRSYLAILTTYVTCGVAIVIVDMCYYIGLVTADSTLVPVVGLVISPLVRVRMRLYLAILTTDITYGVAIVIVDMCYYIGLVTADSTLVPVVGLVISPLVRVRMRLYLAHNATPVTINVARVIIIMSLDVNLTATLTLIPVIVSIGLQYIVCMRLYIISFLTCRTLIPVLVGVINVSLGVEGMICHFSYPLTILRVTSSIARMAVKVVCLVSDIVTYSTLVPVLGVVPSEVVLVSDLTCIVTYITIGITIVVVDVRAYLTERITNVTRGVTSIAILMLLNTVLKTTNGTFIPVVISILVHLGSI